ncbi:MAG: DegV family protein [Actinobacteria bacterium]|nr:DegV family protein [Actinomycetota bacterium]
MVKEDEYVENRSYPRVQVVSDSVASIPPETANALEIEICSLYIHEKDSVKEDVATDVEEYYARIGEMIHAIPTSSQPSQERFEQVFISAAEKKRETLGIFLSQAMSGTFQAAVLAARSVKERFPDWRCRIVDSTTNSYDEAFSVIAAAKAALQGKPLEVCTEVASQVCAASRFIFTPKSLAFLKAGGRIGKANALLGDILHIKPILTVANGTTDVLAKVRSESKALARMAEIFEREMNEYGLKDVVVHYIGSPDDARRWAKDVIESIAKREVQVIPVSPVIGVHVGPAIGIAYECERALPRKLSGPLDIVSI